MGILPWPVADDNTRIMSPYVLQPPFQHIGGLSWATPLDSAVFDDFDDVTDPARSTLSLMEDSVALGPPHTAHQLIEKEGSGAFSHWGAWLYFSTTDGSDPNRNGRVYSVKRDVARYFGRRANHAVGIVENYLKKLPGGASALREAKVLEIGPGRDMGTVMLLAAMGAQRVVAVDRFLGAWQEDWHELFLTILRRAAADAFQVDLTALVREATARQSFDIGSISFIDSAFETLDVNQAGQFDVTLSHSVFEHFYSPSEAARKLKALSSQDAVGAHHVDFRDHRNFGEPLEFLLVDDETYALPETNSDYGRGNRMRYEELCTEMSQAGFEHLASEPLTFSDEDYLKQLMPRLRESDSRFKNFRTDQLRVLSAAITYG
ncbi:MAG: methyltransferase domain-containing protein [Pseudomonadota bacterium]